VSSVSPSNPVANPQGLAGIRPSWSEQIAQRSAELGSLQAVWDEIQADLDAKQAAANAHASIVHEAVRRVAWLAENERTPPWEQARAAPAPSRGADPQADWSRRLDGIARTVAGATPGNRNHLLAWGAWTLAHTGAPHDQITEALTQAARTAGLGEVEIRLTIARAIRKAQP
jgi:hypothetical protein